MQANDMNVIVFWVCVAIAAVVYAVIIWSLVAYRKTKKQEASFHKNTATEIAWTVIPLVIIIAMTIPAAKVLTRLYKGEIEVEMKGESGEAESMQVEHVEQQQQQIALK
ncbi:MAG: cytochrome c oxidase subunit 2 [Pseudohongiellaceae bacterium]|jgi:cytochrome c oxidase subunit 2